MSSRESAAHNYRERYNNDPVFAAAERLRHADNRRARNPWSAPRESSNAALRQLSKRPETDLNDTTIAEAHRDYLLDLEKPKPETGYTIIDRSGSLKK